jgi:hypothetical protein
VIRLICPEKLAMSSDGHTNMLGNLFQGPRKVRGIAREDTD